MSSSIKSLIKDLLRPAKNCLVDHLANRELRLIQSAGVPARPPVFIVGPPRSGTTLVYLAFLRAIKSSYFCNLAAHLPRSPVLVTRLINTIRPLDPPDSFSSEFGETSGWSSPNQGRHIWIRWFPVDAPPGNPQRPLPPLPDEYARQMQGTVALIEKTMGGCFINKAQAHCTRVANLARTFPDMILVRVRRDPYYTAQSIYAGRKSFFGDEKEWFSVKPRNFPELVNKPVLEQISGQIFSLEDGIDLDLNQRPDLPVYEIDYDDFCADPRKVVEDFKKFYLERTGQPLAERHEIPENFKASRTNRLSTEMTDKLQSALDSFPDEGLQGSGNSTTDNQTQQGPGN